MGASRDDFEAYLMSFSAVEVPEGARDRILGPALSAASAPVPREETSWFVAIAAGARAWAERPLWAAALALLLLWANVAVDGLVTGVATQPALSAVESGQPTVGPAVPATDELARRGWFIDLQAVRSRARRRVLEERGPGQ